MKKFRNPLIFGEFYSRIKLFKDTVVVTYLGHLNTLTHDLPKRARTHRT